MLCHCLSRVGCPGESLHSALAYRIHTKQADPVDVDRSGGDAEWETTATDRTIDPRARVKPGHAPATLEHVCRPRYAFSPYWALVRIHWPKGVVGAGVLVAFAPGRGAGNWEVDSPCQWTHNAAVLMGRCATAEVPEDAALIGGVGWHEAKSGAHHSGLRGERGAQREPCWKSKAAARTGGTHADLHSS